MIAVHGHRGLFLITLQLKDLSDHEATVSRILCREDQIYLHHKYGRAGNSVLYPQHHYLLGGKFIGRQPINDTMSRVNLSTENVGASYNVRA